MAETHRYLYLLTGDTEQNKIGLRGLWVSVDTFFRMRREISEQSGKEDLGGITIDVKEPDGTVRQVQVLDIWTRMNWHEDRGGGPRDQGKS